MHIKGGEALVLILFHKTCGPSRRETGTVSETDLRGISRMEDAEGRWSKGEERKECERSREKAPGIYVRLNLPGLKTDAPSSTFKHFQVGCNTGLFVATASAHKPFQIVHGMGIYVIRNCGTLTVADF